MDVETGVLGVAIADPRTPKPEWSETEKWIWARTLAGEEANLNLRHDPQTPRDSWLNPETEADWTDERKVSASFLRDVLLDQTRVALVRSSGLRLTGALLEDSLSLSRGTIEPEFWLDRSRILGVVNLDGVTAQGSLTFDYSYVQHPIEARYATFKDRLQFLGTKLAGLWLKGSTICGVLRVRDGVVVAENTVARERLAPSQQEELGCILLDYATIDGMLEINGAELDRNLDLTHAEITKTVVLDNLRAESADLETSHVGGHVLVRQSRLRSRFNLRETRIDGALEITLARLPGEAPPALDLTRASVKGSVYVMALREPYAPRPSLSGLRLDQTVCGGSAAIDDLLISDYSISGLQVAGMLEFSRLTLPSGQLQHVSVGQNLSFNACSNPQAEDKFVGLSLLQVTVRGSMTINGASKYSSLQVRNCRFENDFELQGIECPKVHLLSSTVGRSLRIFKSTLQWLRLAEIDLGHTLALGLPEKEIRWEPESLLKFVHVRCRDFTETFSGDGPGRASLEYFAYETLGAAVETDRDRIHLIRNDQETRIAQWMLGTQDASGDHNPDLYERLAATYRRSGRTAEANEVLFRGKEHQRRLAFKGWTFRKLVTPLLGLLTGLLLLAIGLAEVEGTTALMLNRNLFDWPGLSRMLRIDVFGSVAVAGGILVVAAAATLPWRAVGLWLLKWTIGYGIGVRAYRVLALLAALVAIGALAMWGSGQTRASWAYFVAYSFVNVFPAIRLDESFAKMEPHHWLKLYYIGHRLAGYVIVALVLAGVTGLLRKT